MPASHSVRFEPNVPLMLRDGTMTYVDVYRPDVEGQFPGLLQRTPYDKSTPASRTGTVDAIRAAVSGYVVVIQDVRGRYSSDGEFYTFVNEMDDGYDSVEWVSAQPWCSGKVGMYGASYVGATQWLAAIAKPPSLAAIAPGVTASDYHEGWTWQGGAFSLAFNLGWSLSNLASANWENISKRLFLPARQLDVLYDTRDNLMDVLKFLPLRDLSDLEGGLAPYYYDWLDHPEFDSYWERVSIEESHDQVSVPAFNWGGWYDIFLGGTIRNFTRMRELGATEDARRGQRLVIGPWVHGGTPSNVSGEVNFGVRSSGAVEDIQGQTLRFFDYWLRGEDTGVSEEKPVRIFVMGENVWRTEDEWPLARAEEVNYYLHSGGKANTMNGDGWLAPEIPVTERPDVYVYDPVDPVPTRGGPLCCDPGTIPTGAYDQRSVEARPDVLVYSTPPLESYVEVTGPVTVTLYASSSARDTDFTAKLLDVCTSGCAINLTDGIVRARYRKPRSPASLIEPGEVHEYRIDLWATSNLFKRGHQIRLEISSSNFPRFDRNTNSGEPIGSDAGLVPALQTVHHSSRYPSHVVLPIVPRD